MIIRGTEHGCVSPVAAMRAVCVCLLAALAATVTAGAGPNYALRLTPGYRAWTLTGQESDSEVTVSQFWTPIHVSVPVRNNSELILSTSAAFSSRDHRAEGDLSMSGNTDLRLELFTSLPGDRVLIHAGLNLPAGKNLETAEDLTLIRALAHPLLGFRVAEYGRGLDGNLGAALAFRLGSRLRLALGAGYIYRGSYQILEEGDTYHPGSELSLSAGLDRPLGPAGGELRIDLTARFYGHDELENEPIFEEGDELELQLQGQAHLGDVRLDALGIAAWKKDHRSRTASAPSWRAIETTPGTRLHVGLLADLPLGERIRLGLAGAWHSLSGSEIATYAGKTLALGPVATWQPGPPWLHLEMQVHLLTGSIDGDELHEGQDLSGYHLGMNVVVR